MIPLRDETPRTRFPLFVIGLVLVNTGVFLYQAFFGPQRYEYYLLAYGLIPSELMSGPDLGWAGRLPLPSVDLFSSMFMHGGLMHLLGNMWFLWIFGDNIEDRLGHMRFLIFYLGTGVLATLTHAVMHSESTIPLVGASGAIAGVLGAYFLLYPRQRIVTLIPILFPFIMPTVRIPAALFLGFWFLFQLLQSAVGGQVAWWAHIGGFAAGFLLVALFLPRRKRRVPKGSRSL